MFLTGYHGATREKANRIEREGGFPLSHGNTEWLGSGIYFYFSIADAYSWKSSDVIYHAVVKIEDDEYCDLDTVEGKLLIRRMVDYVYSKMTDKKPDWSAVQKNQCSVMKMIWDSYPKVQVMAASFSPEQTKIPLLIDPRLKRKEFCVRNNNSIKHTYLIERGELDD